MTAPASPPRFWWLKRLSMGVIVTLLMWAAAHALLWRWTAARLDAHVERWRADGGPLPEQAVLVPPTPTQPDNAATYIVQAEQQLARPNQAQKDHWDNATLVFPLAGEQLKAMRSIAEQDRPAVMRFRKAYDQPYCDWGVPAVVIETMLPRLNESRNLANRLKCAAQVYHHDGDLIEALRYAEDVIFLGDKVADYGPTLVTSLVAAGLHALAGSLIREDVIGRPLPGHSPGQERVKWRKAAPQVRRLMARLLDERADQALIDNVVGERTGLYGIRSVTPGPRLTEPNLFTRPFLYAQIERAIRRHEAAASIVLSADSWTDAQAIPRSSTRAAPASAAEVMTVGIDGYFEVDWTRPMLSFWRAKTDRRAAAVLLAIKLYETDHDGTLPPTLAALVPRYLPALPADPFSTAGASFGYLPDGWVPLIYSAGTDEIDGGGNWQTNPTAEIRSPPWMGYDVPYPLRQPPGSTPLYQWLSPGATTAPASE